RQRGILVSGVQVLQVTPRRARGHWRGLGCWRAAPARRCQGDSKALDRHGRVYRGRVGHRHVYVLV
ncbi:hypothetical protein GGF38_005162, partial [Coemansia sp. RSA 25]